MSRNLIGLVTGLLVLCACVGPEREEHARLPFHVAIIPLSGHVISDPDPSSDTARLGLDARRIEALLVGELNNRCASRATLLTPPEDALALAGASVQQRDAYWLRAALECHADLVLDCDLEFSPVVEHSRNEKFWLNLPLFILGGPACYFVDDRTYRAYAVLRGRLLDVNPILAGRADLEDELSKLADLNSRFESTSLDFLDRAGHNPAAFATSLLVPPGFLMSDSQGAQRSLGSYAERHLAEGLADSLMEHTSDLLLAAPVASFHLDPAVHAVRDGSIVRVIGDVILRRGEVERLDSWSLFASGRSVQGGFAEGKPETSNSLRHQVVRFALNAQISVEDDVRQIRLEIAEAGPNPRIRSFTLLVEAETARDSRHGGI